MERALYEPGHGYYRRPAAGPGRGATSSRPRSCTRSSAPRSGGLLEQAWDAMGRPDPFVVTESGAGAGALAAGLLGGLRDAGSPLLPAIRYRPVEREEARIAALRERLATDGLAGHLVDDATPTARTETGAVVANEVLDALPVHRVVGRPDGLRERFVAVDGEGFAWVEAAPSTPGLAARLEAEGVELADGQVTEVCLAIEGWLAAATVHLAGGPVVLVDYADEPEALHSTARPDGTLRAFARHAVGGDALRHVGRQDLTATVDLAAVRAAAAGAGFDPLGETTQAELLAASGDLASAWLRRPGATIEDALLLRSALARLLDPRGMGGFRVLVFGRGMPPDAALQPSAASIASASRAASRSSRRARHRC